MNEEHQVLERIVRIETRMEETARRLEQYNKHQEEVNRKVMEIHDLLQNAKGVRWTILTGVSIAALGATVIPFFGNVLNWIRGM